MNGAVYDFFHPIIQNKESMKKLLLFCFSSFWAAHYLAQPISITSTVMPSSGDTARYSNGDLTTLGNYIATGGNINWNYSSLVPTSQGLRNFKAALLTPYPFFGTGYGEKIADSLGFGTFKFTEVYNYYKKNGTTSFNAEGLGLKYLGIPLYSFYTNQDELYFFPLNYLDKDSSTFKFATPTVTALPSYQKSGYRITEVDGWGTITTPFGSNKPCIRLVSTQYSIDSIFITIASVPFKFGFPNYQRSYQWITYGEKVPYMEVLGSVIANTFTPTQVRYRDIPRVVGIKENQNHLAFAVYPNPTAGNLIIQIPNTETLKLEIFSLEGKMLMTKELSNDNIVNTHIISVSGFSPGIYFGKLSGKNIVENFKFNSQ